MAEFDIEQDVTKKLDSFRKDSYKSENGNGFIFFWLFTSSVRLFAGSWYARNVFISNLKFMYSSLKKITSKYMNLLVKHTGSGRALCEMPLFFVPYLSQVFRTENMIQ
jgi:tRNA splicing ligase